MFNFIKKGTTTTRLISPVIIEHARINVFSDETVIFFLHDFLPEVNGWNIGEFVWCVVPNPAMVSWHTSLLSILKWVGWPLISPLKISFLVELKFAKWFSSNLMSLYEMQCPDLFKIVATSLLAVIQWGFIPNII